MIYRFADCVLDTDRHALTRAGEPVKVEPQVFHLLRLLVESDGALVTKDALIDAVWQGRIVSEAAISSRINAARQAVGDDGSRQAVIRTITRRGLQLAVPVKINGTERPDPTRPDPPLRQRIRMARTADGAGLAWAEIGEGPPLLRAGHWLSHLERDIESPIWRPLLERLSAGRRLVRYDPRGTGLSERCDPAPDLDTMVADMEIVADAAGLDRFAIYAVSQSVPAAIAFAVRHPERVSALILHAGFLRGAALRDRESGDTMAETFLQLIRQGWGQPDSAFMSAFTTLMLPNGRPEHLRNLIELQLASASPDNAAALRRAINHLDVRERVAQVSVPTLVAHGRGDAVQPFSEGQEIAAMIPGAEFLPLDTNSHVILDHEPAWERLFEGVEEFLARQG
ncbi:alpha/beta fold hydrolase [Pseudooceanicola atlanticus]|uniref:OmpR/PhoB-type domain-containing protein n=1 Tax=Pseudooceanicola atlanticus TaxID=1461694 RepID=A0A0A0EEH6_9RHOB|nr:alpha/beta fold hydrolase [Pseudooceanicola atlanticus]KGM48493.1 hypothetical protein ATO9_12740 [Pseudooceanicola atlanticus]